MIFLSKVDGYCQFWTIPGAPALHEKDADIVSRYSVTSEHCVKTEDPNDELFYAANFLSTSDTPKDGSVVCRLDADGKYVLNIKGKKGNCKTASEFLESDLGGDLIFVPIPDSSKDGITGERVCTSQPRVGCNDQFDLLFAEDTIEMSAVLAKNFDSKDACGGEYFRNSWEGAKEMLFYLGVTAISGFEKGEATPFKLKRDAFKGYSMKTDSLEMCGQAAMRMTWLDSGIRAEEAGRAGNFSFWGWLGIGIAVSLAIYLATRDFNRAKQVGFGVVNVALDWVMSTVIMDNRRLTVLGPLGSLRGGGAESLIGAAKFFTYVATAMFLIELTIMFLERKEDPEKKEWSRKMFYMKCGNLLKDIPLFFITFVYMCSVYFQLVVIGAPKDGFSLLTFFWQGGMLVKEVVEILQQRGVCLFDSDSFDTSNENYTKGDLEVGSNGQIKANPLFDGNPQKTASVKKTSSVKKASPVKKTSSVKKASPVKKTSVKKAPVSGRGPAAMAALRAASAKKRAT